MKVVINSVRGYLNPSPTLIMKYAELLGKKAYFYERVLFYRDEHSITHFKVDPYERKNNSDVITTTEDCGKAATDESVYKNYFSINRVDRNDVILIQAVESLKAEGLDEQTNELEIIEIPDSIEFHISYDEDDYDYSGETIVEEHRTWNARKGE